MNKAGFIVLAAGMATRFGSDKMAARLPGNSCSIFEQMLHNIPSTLPIHVVLRPSQIESIEVLERLQIPYSGDESLQRSLGDSIVEGVTRTKHWGGWILCLADMPWVLPTTYQNLWQALQKHSIIRPVYSQNGVDQPGNPVGFGPSLREELLGLSGQSGGRSILQTRQVHHVRTQDKGVVLDIDTPSDLTCQSEADSL